MLIQRNIITLTLLMAFTVCAHAQEASANHDAAKMNQIMVMETGAGVLTPELYYTLLHSSYKKTAVAKNKLGYRTLAGIASYQQVEYADSIDSVLTKRAAVEALNMADRQVDLAWSTEGTKITEKMSAFQKNINRIVPAGGTAADRERWKMYYNMFEKAIDATRDAYMPNAQRKREYLNIYADIVKQNETLVKTLVLWSNKTKTSSLLSCRNNYQKSDKASAITAAYNKWREAGWNTGGSAASSSSGGDNEGGEEAVVR